MMPTRDEIVAEINRRAAAGAFDDRQLAALAELRRRGVIPAAEQPAAPPPAPAGPGLPVGGLGAVGTLAARAATGDLRGALGVLPDAAAGVRRFREAQADRAPQPDRSVLGEFGAGIARGFFRAPGQLAQAGAAAASQVERVTGDTLATDFVQRAGRVISDVQEGAVQGQGLRASPQGESFARDLAGGVGESIPQLAAAVGASVATGGTGGLLMFAGTSAAPVVGSTYDAALREHGDEARAADEATVAGGITLLTSYLTGPLGARLAGSPVGRKLMEQASRTALGRIGSRAALGFAGEGSQGLVEEEFQALAEALIRHGDRDLLRVALEDRTMRDRLLAFLSEGIAGGALGGAAGALGGRGQQPSPAASADATSVGIPAPEPTEAAAPAPSLPALPDAVGLARQRLTEAEEALAREQAAVQQAPGESRVFVADAEGRVLSPEQQAQVSFEGTQVFDESDPSTRLDLFTDETTGSTFATMPGESMIAGLEAQRARYAEAEAEAAARKPLAQPTRVSDDGLRASFSGTSPTAQADAEAYAASLRSDLPDDAITVRRLPGRAGYEVVIQPGAARAAAIRGEIDGWSPTARRRLVRRAREAGHDVRTPEDVKALPDRQLLQLAAPDALAAETSAAASAERAASTRPGVPGRPGAPTRQAGPAAPDRRGAGGEMPRGVRGERRAGRDRRTPDLAAERAEIEALFREGRAEEAQARITALQDRARRDPKGTGLLNGTEWDARLADAKAEIDEGRRVRHVAVLDVANLGLMNTVRGHQDADAKLAEIARAVLEVAGPEAAFRTGGDEMGVLFPPGTTKLQARKMLRDIEAKVGFDPVVPGASVFMAGEVGTLSKGKTIKETLEEIEKRGEAKKRKIKEERGEPTSISKDEAARLAAERQAAEAPAPEAREPSAVRAAAAEVRRRRAELAEAEARRDAAMVTGRISAMQAAPIEGTSHKRRVPRWVEDWITPISSRIRDISPAIFDRLMRMEFNTYVSRERLKKELSGPAERLSSRLKDAGRYAGFKYAVLNARFDEARALVSEVDPALAEDFDAFVNTFRNLLDAQRAAGIDIGEIENYWPRFIKDYKGLMKAMGKEQGRFDLAWDLARKAHGRPLTAEQKVEIANAVIQGYGPRKPGSYGPPNARARSVDEVTAEMLPHYLDPIEAAFRYIDGATYATERARFLGKNATPDTLHETVGALIERESPRLTPEQQDELHGLLTTRLVADMSPTSRGVRNFKQLTYLLTLSQFRSTLTQLTDVAITAAEHGLTATAAGVKAAIRLTPRDKRFMMEDVGIHAYGEEFKDIGRIARATDWALRKTGFKAIDRLGKESRLNAAHSAMRAAVANPQGEAYRRFEDRYRPVLGDAAFRRAVADLREGKRTEDVRYLLFLDASRIQPITTSQMPQRYLAMPNGRIIYSLKTFMLMQMDHVRRDMVRKIATPGERREGLAHLARYLVAFTLLGVPLEAVKDWIMGRRVSAEQIPDRVVDSLLLATGQSRYMVEGAWDDPAEAAKNLISPPLAWASAGWQDLRSLGNGGLRSVRYAPLVGDLLYFHSPIGRGYHLNKREADAEYRKLLRELRAQAAEAARTGDTALASSLISVYNERRTQGPGDGRKTPITMGTLRADIERRGREGEE